MGALYHTHSGGSRHTVARPRTVSGKRFQWTQLLYFICLWTISASVRFGNIIHYISAPERDRLQKNETNHSVRPRLLLSESIVRPACIGWENGVERRGVSLTARRLWLSAGGRATRHNMACGGVLNRWSAPSQGVYVCILWRNVMRPSWYGCDDNDWW